MSAPHQLTIAAHVTNLATIADFIQSVTTEAGFGPKAAYSIEMAVDEACSNIIEHAYGDDLSGDITLECHHRPDGLLIEIFDRGRTFDLAAVPSFDPAAPLEARGRRGMGMFFIYKLMDRVQFHFDTPRGNQLILFKAYTDE